MGFNGGRRQKAHQHMAVGVIMSRKGAMHDPVSHRLGLEDGVRPGALLFGDWLYRNKASRELYS